MINLPLANLFTSYTDSNGMGQAIVILQLLISIISWSVMLSRGLTLNTIKKSCTYFRSYFSKSPKVFDMYIHRKIGTSPAARIYTTGCDAIFKNTEDTLNIGYISKGQYQLFKGATEEELAKQNVNLESCMGFLALASAMTPMIGLLGTVWGILDAFQAMGKSGSALLSEVAPGLSSALLTTVVGLLVAIPSSIGYNLLLGQIRKISISLDAFTDEFLARVTEEHTQDR